MSEENTQEAVETAATVETATVRFLRNVPYEGDGMTPGDTATVEAEKAAWYVAEGHAEFVTDEEEKPKGKKK